MADRAIYPGSIANAVLDIESTDGTTIQDFVTAGPSGSRINNISVTSTDTSNIDLMVFHNDSSNDYLIARVTIPAGSGSDGTNPPVSLLNDTDMPFIGTDLSYYLETGHKLRVGAESAVTTAKKISLVATIGNY